jgi:hypothetical protein
MRDRSGLMTHIAEPNDRPRPLPVASMSKLLFDIIAGICAKARE